MMAEREEEGRSEDNDEYVMAADVKGVGDPKVLPFRLASCTNSTQSSVLGSERQESCT